VPAGLNELLNTVSQSADLLGAPHVSQLVLTTPVNSIPPSGCLTHGTLDLEFVPTVQVMVWRQNDEMLLCSNHYRYCTSSSAAAVPSPHSSLADFSAPSEPSSRNAGRSRSASVCCLEPAKF